MRDTLRLMWRGFAMSMDLVVGAVRSLSQARSSSTHEPARERTAPLVKQTAPRQQPPGSIRTTISSSPAMSKGTVSPADKMSRLPGGELAFQHALQAGRSAGLDIHSRVLPVDIGFMVFVRGERTISRANPPPDNAEHIQPFVVLHLLQRAAGRVRFEIVDSDGQRLFVHEDLHDLDLGANLISPAARLKILDAHNFAGEWKLLVSADGVPLAAHGFTWYESRENLLRRHLSEDGEIQVDAREHLVSKDPFDRVTLDDLLSDQLPPDAASQQRAARR